MQQRNGLAFATLFVVAMGALVPTLHGTVRVVWIVVLSAAAAVGLVGWLRLDVVVRNLRHRRRRALWDGSHSRWRMRVRQTAIVPGSTQGLALILFPPAHLARREAMHRGSLLGGNPCACTIYRGQNEILHSPDLSPSQDGTISVEVSTFYPAPQPSLSPGRYRVTWEIAGSSLPVRPKELRMGEGGVIIQASWTTARMRLRQWFRARWTAIVALSREDTSP
jgi:hypothetical protein